MKLPFGLKEGATVLLDTAPIVAVLDGTDAALKKRFMPLFYAAENGDLFIVVSVIALAEVMAGPLFHGDEILAERYKRALTSTRNWSVQPVSVETAALASRMRAKYRLKLPDAIQIATALNAGAGALITYDRDFRGITELPIIG
ncbi:MAG: PIN domain-containing protein [Myxococcota bacterium]|jgi:predicted nucleic acid-binding protein